MIQNDMVYNTIKKLSTLISMDNKKPHASTVTNTVWQMNSIKALNNSFNVLMSYRLWNPPAKSTDSGD